MIGCFEIPHKLPSLNDYIAKNRLSKYAGAEFKKQIGKGIKLCIVSAKNRGLINAVDEKVDVLIDFYEPTKRRDVDNVQSSQKFILDSLVETEILKNDNPKHIGQIYHRIFYGSEKVIVMLYKENELKIQVEE